MIRDFFQHILVQMVEKKSILFFIIFIFLDAYSELKAMTRGVLLDSSVLNSGVHI